MPPFMDQPSSMDGALGARVWRIDSQVLREGLIGVDPSRATTAPAPMHRGMPTRAVPTSPAACQPQAPPTLGTDHKQVVSRMAAARSGTWHHVDVVGEDGL